MSTQNTLTVSAEVHASLEKTWERWTTPEHITQWNFASDDWQCPNAINELKPGGKMSWRMEAKDGSMGFDFSGKYEKIELHQHISLLLDDGRSVKVDFTEKNGMTLVTETFETENQNPTEMQRAGWQAILDNFKKHAEKPE
jgi:uncharacterized protein YndB with AHSA1/START domain